MSQHERRTASVFHRFIVVGGALEDTFSCFPYVLCYFPFFLAFQAEGSVENRSVPTGVLLLLGFSSFAWVTRFSATLFSIVGAFVSEEVSKSSTGSFNYLDAVS